MSLKSFSLVLGILVVFTQQSEGRKYLTPINGWFKTACIPENIKENDHYICDKGGKMRCMPGYTNEASYCKDPICHPRCIEGQGNCTKPNCCTCEVGWTGVDCSKCVCLPGCINGNCTLPFQCNCQHGWQGMLCNKPICKKGCVNGDCSMPGECNCFPGWVGPTCSECIKLPGCSEHGYCTKPLECKCEPGYEGNFCEKPICRENCNKTTGFCNKPGECWCVPGWTGPECETCVPYPGCVYGRCVKPWECICNNGYTGMLCNQLPGDVKTTTTTPAPVAYGPGAVVGQETGLGLDFTRGNENIKDVGPQGGAFINFFNQQTQEQNISDIGLTGNQAQIVHGLDFNWDQDQSSLDFGFGGNSLIPLIEEASLQNNKSKPSGSGLSLNPRNKDAEETRNRINHTINNSNLVQTDQVAAFVLSSTQKTEQKQESNTTILDSTIAATTITSTSTTTPTSITTTIPNTTTTPTETTTLITTQNTTTTPDTSTTTTPTTTTTTTPTITTTTTTTITDTTTTIPATTTTPVTTTTITTTTTVTTTTKAAVTIPELQTTLYFDQITLFPQINNATGLPNSVIFTEQPFTEITNPNTSHQKNISQNEGTNPNSQSTNKIQSSNEQSIVVSSSTLPNDLITANHNTPTLLQIISNNPTTGNNPQYGISQTNIGGASQKNSFSTPVSQESSYTAKFQPDRDETISQNINTSQKNLIILDNVKNGTLPSESYNLENPIQSVELVPVTQDNNSLQSTAQSTSFLKRDSQSSTPAIDSNKDITTTGDTTAEIKIAPESTKQTDNVSSLSLPSFSKSNDENNVQSDLTARQDFVININPLQATDQGSNPRILNIVTQPSVFTLNSKSYFSNPQTSTQTSELITTLTVGQPSAAQPDNNTFKRNAQTLKEPSEPISEFASIQPSTAQAETRNAEANTQNKIPGPDGQTPIEVQPVGQNLKNFPQISLKIPFESNNKSQATFQIYESLDSSSITRASVIQTELTNPQTSTQTSDINVSSIPQASTNVKNKQDSSVQTETQPKQDLTEKLVFEFNRELNNFQTIGYSDLVVATANPETQPNNNQVQLILSPKFQSFVSTPPNPSKPTVAPQLSDSPTGLLDASLTITTEPRIDFIGASIDRSSSKDKQVNPTFQGQGDSLLTTRSSSSSESFLSDSENSFNIKEPLSKGDSLHLNIQLGERSIKLSLPSEESSTTLPGNEDQFVVVQSESLLQQTTDPNPVRIFSK